jgi:hypothetical protein
MATGCRTWPWPTWFQQRFGADQQHATAVNLVSFAAHRKFNAKEVQNGFAEGGTITTVLTRRGSADGGGDPKKLGEETMKNELRVCVALLILLAVASGVWA